MITYLIYSTLSMAILLLFYKALLIKEKMYHFNRGYLFFGLIFSLTIPLVPVGISGDFLTSEEASVSSGATILPSIQNAEPVDITPFIESDSVLPFSGKKSEFGGLIIPLAVGIYTMVVLFLFVRLLRIIHMIQVRADRNPSTLFEGLEVVLLSENVVPHTFLSIIFVNKKRYERGEISRDILLHEAAHARQKHSIDILFIEVLKIIFWFNPLLYFYKRAIHLNHEFLADDAVLKTGVPTTLYQKTLLQSLLHKPSFTLVSNLHFGLTKKRFQMMTQTGSRVRSAIKISSLVPLFLVLSLILGCESNPAEADSTHKEVTIELTDSELIRLNGEEMDLSKLEDILEEFSKNHNLRFHIKEHPDMKSGPVFTVNRLVHKYSNPKDGMRFTLLGITINSENEIIVDDTSLNLDDLRALLDEEGSDNSKIINLRVSRSADFQTILDVQNVLRTQGSRRINYSTITDESDTAKQVSEIVVTPDNGIRPASYTSLDLSTPYFKLEPIEYPPYGSLRFRPDNGFAEGYMNLQTILSEAFHLPVFRIIGNERLLHQTYEFAFVNTGDERTFYQNLRNEITNTHSFDIQKTQQNIPKYELHLINEGHKMSPSRHEQKRIYYSNGNINGVNTSMDDFARFLTRRLNKEVINSTGLEGAFDVNVESIDFSEAAVFTENVKEQLGLILKPVIETDQVLVVR